MTGEEARGSVGVPKVFSRVEIMAVYRPLEFFNSSLGKLRFHDLALCAGASSCRNMFVPLS